MPDSENNSVSESVQTDDDSGAIAIEAYRKLREKQLTVDGKISEQNQDIIIKD